MQRDPRDLGPFAHEGLFRRIAPFCAAMLLAAGIAAGRVSPDRLALFLAAAGASAALVAMALLLPWRRLPRWTQAIPPLAYLPAVGLLREATGGGASPFTLLVLLPVMVFALYGNRREVVAALVLMVLVLGFPQLFVGGSAYPPSELNRAGLVTAVSAFVGMTVHSLVSSLRDSTRTVAAGERSARESRDHFVGVLEAATQFSIIATDADGVITVFNEGASRMLGYAPEEVIGLTPALLHDPDEVAQRAHELGIEPGFEVLVAVARTGESEVRDWTYIRSSGERITVSLTVSAMRDADGTPWGFIGVAQDVTEQRRNETQIREQAQRAALINELTHAIRQDLDMTSVQRRATSALGQALAADRVVICNTGADADAGGAIAEIWTRPGVRPVPLGTPVPDGIARLSRRTSGHDSALVIFDTEEDSRLSPGEAAQIGATLGIRGFLGAPMWVGSRLIGWLSVHATRTRTWTGNDIAIVQALARTVGAAVLQAQAHQQELEVICRMRDLDQTKSDFVSSVSHELRTPLTSITGYLEMLVEGDAGPLTPDQLQLVEVVERNSHRLLALIEELLTLSRIESGTNRPGVDRVDLTAVIADVHRAVLPMLGERRLHFELDVPEDVGRVTGDAGQLEQVVFNLVTNAVKFTPDGGRVTVRAGIEAGRVRLAVTDTGIGIPADEQGHLFTRFFRSSTAREHAIQGTGLGLAIVKSIVESHGGSIGVESAPGEGTTVTVELPLAAQAAERVGAA